MTRRSKTVWTLLIAVSLVFQIFTALVLTGVEATRYGTPDSDGNAFGFNSPVTWGHVGVMIGNVTWQGYLDEVGWYPTLCIIAHLAGLWVLWDGTVSRRARQWFFGLQMVVFPLALNPLFWACLLMLGSYWPIDGEWFSDGPVHPVLSQVTWFLISAALWGRDVCREEAGERKFIARYG